MTEHDKEQKFLNNVRNTLHKSLDAIDAETTSRIKQARYQALEQGHNKSSWLMPFSAIAVTASVVTLSVTLWFTPFNEMNEELVLEDISLLTASEELDFYQELEFYNWLDDEQING